MVSYCFFLCTVIICTISERSVLTDLLQQEGCQTDLRFQLFQKNIRDKVPRNKHRMLARHGKTMIWLLVAFYAPHNSFYITHQPSYVFFREDVPVSGLIDQRKKHTNTSSQFTTFLSFALKCSEEIVTRVIFKHV